MPYQIGYVDNTGSEGYAHWQMLLTIHHFAGGYGTLAAPAFTGAGNGTLTKLDTHPATVTETWTIKCTSAPSVGNEVWSVTGSVSGAKASATTGVAYDNTLLAFTVAAGSTAFAVNDQFTIAATQGALSAIGRAWTVLHYLNPNDITQNRELILQGSGLSGTEQIFVGFRSYQSVSADYYNLSVAGFTGYVAGNAFTAQPGFCESGIPAHNQRIDYWLVVNGQRLALCMKVGLPVYESGYVGKILPYAAPSQFPYPLAVIGMLNGASPTRYSETTHSMGFKGNVPNNSLRWLDGSYKNPQSYPWNNPVLGGGCQLRDTAGEYPMLPIILNEAAPNIFGELDGIEYVSNFNNTVESVVQSGGTPVVDNPAWSAQDRVDAIVAAGGTPYVALQDVWRTSFNDFFVMRMT